LGACLAVQSPVQSSGSVQASTAASGGVYTDAQATRGKDIFSSMCTGCHNISSQSGTAFAKRWNGVQVSELFNVLTDTMPKDDPGALAPQERADVIAYLLKINGLAAGTAELAPDPELLKKIVIDLVK
jgi:mono/diheme cytochrome c family protein